jgi:hypothetical protein
MSRPSDFLIQSRYVFPLLRYLRLRTEARQSQSQRTRRSLYHRAAKIERLMPPILLKLYLHHGWSLEQVERAFQTAR